MQIHKKSTKGRRSAPAPQAPRTQGVTQARTQPGKSTVPKPGDMITMSGKREEFIGFSIDNDQVLVHTVTDSTRGSQIQGTHTRFFYRQSAEMEPASNQQPAAQRGAQEATVSGEGPNSGEPPETPTTPPNKRAGSIGPQRTPRAPRKAPAVVRNREEPSQSSNTAPKAEKRIHNGQMKPRNRRNKAWDDALLHDAAHLHRFDAGPSFLDQEDLLLTRPRGLGPSGTECSL